MKSTPKKLKYASAKTISENANISKRELSRQLFNTVDKFLDVRALFPKTKLDMRKGFTLKQMDKIAREARKFAQLAGGERYLENDFAPVKKTKAARDYMDKVGLPKQARGVLLPGGSKIKGGVTVGKDGGLHYMAGEREQSQFPLDFATERTVEKSLRAHSKKINQPDTVSYIATHGGKIYNRKNNIPPPEVFGDEEYEEDGEEKDATDLIVENAIELHNKYAEMAAAGAFRANGRLAAHPSKWGAVLITEGR